MQIDDKLRSIQTAAIVANATEVATNVLSGMAGKDISSKLLRGISERFSIALNNKLRNVRGDK